MEKILNDLLMLLCRSISNRRLYFTEHPKVTEYTDNFLKSLKHFFNKHNKQDLFIGIIDGHFIYEGSKLVGPSIVGHQFILITEMLNCGGIIFKKEITAIEFNRFLNVTTAIMDRLESLDAARELFRENGINEITLASTYQDLSKIALAENKVAWQGKDTAGLLESPTMVYQALFDTVTMAHGSAALDRNIDLSNARAVSEFMLQYIHKGFGDMMQHIYYPDYENYTIGHSVRVSALVVYTGSVFGWDDKILHDVGTAALMHDIGKSKISDDILYKPGKLTPEEREVMQYHSRLGAEILIAQEGTTSLDLAAAWGHHQRYDGSGYPSRPGWAQLNHITELLHICDVFEALTAIRPYKEAIAPKDAYAIMLQDKGAFNPPLLASFIAAIGLYPPGTQVELSDQRIGVVTGVGEDIRRPRVKITKRSDGASITDERDQYEVDLNSYEGKKVIVKNLILEYLSD